MNLTPIREEMPDFLDYEHRGEDSGILHLGQGTFAPVTPGCGPMTSVEGT